jgi:hypothetical protein
MKNLSVLFVLVMLTVVVSANFCSAQRSKAYSGDKSSRIITKSQESFKSLVEDLKEQQAKLEKRRDKMAKKPDYYAALLVETDSLIKVYQTKIMSLEDQMVASVTAAVNKDEENRVELKSRNATEFADAYLTIKYADNLSANNGGAQANANSGKQLMGMVENTTYDNPVVVTVTGPANFRREFTLGAKSKSPAFELPAIGNYTAYFISGRNRTACVTKKAGPNIVYYDGATPLDFKATFIY